MRTRIKVCCIESADAMATAVGQGADALGFVGPMPSGTGILRLDTARALIARVPPGIASFLLSSAVDAEQLVEEARSTGAAVLQIVDRVAPAAYATLRRALPALRIVQVVHVEGEAAIDEALEVGARVDAVLLDSGSRAGPVALLGGTGAVHDWAISREIAGRCPVPVWLAGGLTPGNVTAAIRTVHPFGVDLCTGLRTAGMLDEAKLRAFVSAVAAA